MNNKIELPWEPWLREKIQSRLPRWRSKPRDKERDFEKTCFNQRQYNLQNVAEVDCSNDSGTLDNTGETAVTFVNKKRTLTRLKTLYAITMRNTTEVRENA